MKTLIRVPATSANLGPGFDCLGLALDLWNEVEVEISGETVEITVHGEGEASIPRSKKNAIYKAMRAYAELHHKLLPTGLKLICRNAIPLGSGLGSSAAAVVAGIKTASALLAIPEHLTDQLECAAQLEGHPDNVAPCLLGGLVIAINEGEHVIAKKLSVAPLSLVVAVPEFNFSTRSSRAALPAQVARRDAVYNLGRLSLLIDALASGDVDLLSVAMQDRLHQPQRLPLIPGAENAFSAARKAGAVAVALSGAGPSLLAILRKSEDDHKVGNAILEEFAKAGLKARVLTPEIALSGASVTTI